jgi:hypothetical protein
VAWRVLAIFYATTVRAAEPTTAWRAMVGNQIGSNNTYIVYVALGTPRVIFRINGTTRARFSRDPDYLINVSNPDFS